MPVENLIIDIGNTYAKLALFREDRLIEICRENVSIPKAFSKLTQGFEIKAAIVSSVIDLAPETESFIRSCPFPVHFLSADTPIPIKIGYGTPRTLGADRLAAAVAAKEMYPGKNLLIIDAGTAITYDFLSQDGTFTGGNITPGKQMRFESLHNQTARLPLVDENGDCPLTGYDTPSAIRGGVMKGIAYEMNGYIRDYKKTYPDLSVLLTGGDAPLFEQELEGKYTAERHLVLKGLNRILYYNESI